MNSELSRLRIHIGGAVQGVGFRPFLFRLATELNLAGWVRNTSQGVTVEVEGNTEQVQQFLLRIEPEKPPLSFLQSLESSYLEVTGMKEFVILESETADEKSALVLPDVATCQDCLREIFDPNNRRYFYPFTNCTNCGPRFSIIEALPYDRPNTSMKHFAMCKLCLEEYENPRDRRFHAQPNACPCCGPRPELWNSGGERVSSNRRALVDAAQAIRNGSIVAVKGIGGFHLMTLAGSNDAVCRLRELKHREEKPFALMFPSMSAVKMACEVSAVEERLLRSPAAPIVLLRSLPEASRSIAPSVAPNNPCLGVMLPCAPLQHLLLSETGCPVIATSGNLSDEPICIDDQEALKRLGGIADLFLTHDRKIVRHVDDSIVRVMAGRETILRRARGFAPLPLPLPKFSEAPMSETLAVGGHLKNTVALTAGSQVFLSQHIGDLETAQASAAFQRVIRDFEHLWEIKPKQIVADGHPDYLSTKFALRCGLPVFRAQHHYAHILACMGENEILPPVLGVAWDGTGDGLDGTIWGGEFLVVKQNVTFERAAHFRQFRLPGGEQAAREPRRSAIGLLHTLFGSALFSMKESPAVRAFSAAECNVLKTMLERQVNSPLTSSAGRLFDVAASLAGIRQVMRFEGQAAMELEFLLDANASSAGSYSPPRLETGNPRRPAILDWEPAINEMIADVKQGISLNVISARFHNWLVETIVAVARIMDIQRVALSGGCFQNKYLCEQTVFRLREEGFRPCWHQRVPPNDGGIAFGQAVAAVRNQVSHQD